MPEEDSDSRLIDALLAEAEGEDVYAILRLEKRRDRSAVVEGKRVDGVGASYSGGLGIQVFTQSGHNGFAAVDDPNLERGLTALRRAAGAARAAEASELMASTSVFGLTAHRGNVDPETPYAFDDVDVGEMKAATLSFAEELVGEIGEVMARTAFGISLSRWRIARSDGTDVSFSIPRSHFGVSLVARRGSEAARTQASTTGMSYEPLLKKNLRGSLKDRAVRAAGLALEILAAPYYPAGSYPILIDYALAKGLAHEAFGHAAESDGLDSSILGDGGRFRSGERFGGENVSIIDESLPGDNAFQPFSTNGVPRRKTVILRNGVLGEALADIHTAASAGTAVTGAGRQASFAALPLPRMSNIRMEVSDAWPVPEGRDAHDWTPEEIRDLLVASGDLAAGGRVVFLSGYRGGQVNPALGDFVFNSAALYELTPESVTLHKPGIFSGRIEAALHSVVRGYGPLRLDAAGTCGKAGQGVPSSGGSHHFVLIDENPEIRIGGRS